MSKPVVFVLDDDADFRALIGVYLNNLGVECELYEKPEDFIARLKDKQPQICFIDLNIEGVTVGFALIKAIRAKLGPDIPLFVVSGTSEPERIAHAVEIGATDYVVKPVDRDLLATKLAQFVSSSEIKTSGLPYFTAPASRSAATVRVDFEVETIDEVGIQLVSPHLLVKGALVQMEGPWVEEVTGQKMMNITVVSTSANPSTKEFNAYAEFDTSKEEVIMHIRNWLSKNLLSGGTLVKK